MPMGMSTKGMEQIMQWHMNHNIRYFDYGPDRNLLEYGSEEPPAISFERARGIPLILVDGLLDDATDYRAENDFYIEHQLGPIVFNGTYDYTHYSFYIGNDMSFVEDIYNAIQDFTPILISSS